MPSTRTLLAAGAVAGPLLVGVLLGQAVWRTDHDIGTDPISSLSLGPYGWVQITTFVVVGVLVAAFGLGVWRLRAEGAALAVTGALLGIMGAGLVGVGAFVVDPVAWHGVVHDVATGVAINAGLLAVLVLSVRWWRAGERGPALYGLATAAVCAGLGWSAGVGTIALRHTGVVLVLTAWLTTTAVMLLRRPELRHRGTDEPVV